MVDRLANWEICEERFPYAASIFCKLDVSAVPVFASIQVSITKVSSLELFSVKPKFVEVAKNHTSFILFVLR
jgi:hypothetical protein